MRRRSRSAGGHVPGVPPAHPCSRALVETHVAELREQVPAQEPLVELDGPRAKDAVGEPITSCYAAGQCVVATGLGLLTTHDGFRTVSFFSGPAVVIRGMSVTGFESVFCNAGALCLAFSSSAGNADGPPYPAFEARSTNGGITWRLHTLAPVAGPFSASCPNSKLCLLSTVSALLRSNDGGMNWTSVLPRNLPSGAEGLGSGWAVACPNSKDCIVTWNSGVVTVSNDGGTHWAIRSMVPPRLAQNGVVAEGITCISVTQCLAWIPQQDQSTPLIVRSSDGGMIWKGESIPTDFNPGDVACTIRSCIATGTGATDGNHVEFAQRGPLPYQ
jgi:hypothetical protein